ncbi:MAG TPA: hypothetical protein VFF88_00425, partial [Methylocella sp.]|nr:hypothetical protein [Methylocella sp.]
MQRLPFKRAGDKSAGETLADACPQGKVEIAAAARLLNFPEAIQLFPICVPECLLRETARIADSTEHHQRAHLEVPGEPIEGPIQLLIGSKLFAKNSERNKKLGGHPVAPILHPMCRRR